MQGHLGRDEISHRSRIAHLELMTSGLLPVFGQQVLQENRRVITPSQRKIATYGNCVSGFDVERKGIEPSTSALRTQRSPN